MNEIVFKRGMRIPVQMTPAALHEKFDGRSHIRTGLIVGESTNGLQWIIIRDGLKSRESYNKVFWVPRTTP